ncbi:cupin domain-containing protein [Glycocaulis profundi]|nr:cupin domain-containing protein [Glycocaulis profundi]
MTLSCRMALTFAAAAMLTAPALAQPDQAFTRQADDPALEWADCPGFMPEGCGLAVLQGDPGQRNADVFFRLPGGATAIRHWHSSAERMVLVSGQMSIDTDGQDAVTLHTGDYAYMPARLPHSAECVSEEACVLFIAFEDPVDAVEGAPE